VCVSHTKPGGTAGILILSQQVIAGTGFFVFSGRLFHVCLHKTMAQPRCIRNFEPAFERIKTNLKGSINL
jgi:hypothetical protein